MLERLSLEPEARPRKEHSSLERGVGSSKMEGLRGLASSPSTGFFTRRRRLSASFCRRATRLSTRFSSATRAAAVSRRVLAWVSMVFTSSWTLVTAASAASTGVASTTFTAATTGAATSGAAAFLVALAALGAATSGAATTGAATTGAAATGAFLDTDLVVLAAGALIILVAVEEFMAGIRIVKRSLESIFGPLCIFAGVKIFYSNSSLNDLYFIVGLKTKVLDFSKIQQRNWTQSPYSKSTYHLSS